MTTLKVGVAGAGVFGNYHAQKAAASARTELIGVYDIDLERATRIASQFGAKGFDNYEAFLDACDAIVIAVPGPAAISCRWGIRSGLSRGQWACWRSKRHPC